MTTLNVILTELRVSLLPTDDIDFHTWSVAVAWRSDDKYAVTHIGYVFNSDGEWEYEPQPSSRDDEFLARTRFDYWTAYRLACEQAPLVRINGMTAADVLAKKVGRS